MAHFGRIFIIASNCSKKGKSRIDFSTWLLIYAGNYLLSHITLDLDECPFPTLADAPRPAHGYTRLQCPVRLCAILGMRCTDRSRTD